MNDTLDAVLRDHVFDEVLVAGIADEQWHGAGQQRGKSGRQIVDHDDVFAGVRQRMNRMTSNIAGATCDEHGPGTPLPFLFGGDARGLGVKRGFRHR
jgi:hypothetical protein